MNCHLRGEVLFCLVNKLPSQNDEATKSEPELFRPFVGMTSHTFIWNTFLNFHVEYLRRVATARKRCLISLEVFLFFRIMFAGISDNLVFLF